MAVIVQDGQLVLTGFVGESSLVIDGNIWFDGFSHPEVVEALGQIDDEAHLVVHLNSGGGLAIQGAAIRSTLADRAGRTDVVIDGTAASAASLIAMAGETISMSLGSTMMIHDPSGFTWGTAADHEKSIRALDSLSNAYARVYARRSGTSEEEARALMRAETWFGPEEAVAAGYADEILDEAAEAVAAFPYHLYASAPRDLAAQARAEGWRLPLAGMSERPAAPAAPNARKETTMTTPNTAPVAPSGSTPAPTASTPTPPQTPPAPVASEPVATAETTTATPVEEDRARISAILDHANAKGRETLARHFALETSLSAEEAIAALFKAPKAAAGLGARMSGENTDLEVPQGDAPSKGPSMADRMRQKFAK